jgi:hypothetical protein
VILQITFIDGLPLSENIYDAEESAACPRRKKLIVIVFVEDVDVKIAGSCKSFNIL